MVCNIPDDCDAYFEGLSLEALIAELRRLKGCSQSLDSKTQKAELKELKQQIVAARRILLRRSEEILRQMQQTALAHPPNHPERRKLILPMIKMIENCGEFPFLGDVDPDYQEVLKETRRWFSRTLANTSTEFPIIQDYRRTLLERLLYRIEQSGRVWNPKHQDRIYQEAYNETRLWLFRNFHNFGETNTIQNRGTMTFAGWFTYTLTKWRLPECRGKAIRQERNRQKALFVIELKILIYRMFAQRLIKSTATRLWLMLAAKFKLPKNPPEIEPIIVSVDSFRSADGEAFDGWETFLPKIEPTEWISNDPSELVARSERIQAIRDCVINCERLKTMRVPKHPEITCQDLLLLRLPDPNADPPRWWIYSWEELVEKYQVPKKQLTRCYDRHLTNSRCQTWLAQCLQKLEDNLP